MVENGVKNHKPNPNLFFGFATWTGGEYVNYYTTDLDWRRVC